MVGVVNWYGTSLIDHDGADSDMQGGDVIFVSTSRPGIHNYVRQFCLANHI